MSFLPAILNNLRLPFTALQLRDHIQSFFQRLPHLSLLVGAVGLGWRAMLVAEPAGPLVVHPTPVVASPPAGSQLVVISANLKHDFPRYRDRIARLEAFAELVEMQEADILLLQEVARTGNFNTDEWLRDRLGMAYVYARANGHQNGIGFEEGVAIFSRFPLENPEVRELDSSWNPFTRRVGLRVQVQLPGGNVEAFSVHLGILPPGNEQQIQVLQDWVEQSAGLQPAIVGGDFNAEPASKRIQQLQTIWLDSFTAADAGSVPTTHALEAPWGTTLREHRLDYIFLIPGQYSWQPAETRHLVTDPIPHSDHRVVVTLLQQAP